MKIKLLLCLVLLLSGCGEDTVTPDPELNEYSYPETKEELVEAFINSYGDMDIDNYSDCISENFKFIFTINDQSQYQLPSRYLERAEDVLIMERVFSGNSHEKPDGTTQPGLQSITIANWSMVGPSWVLTPAEHAEFPNSYRGIFYVWMIYAENGSQHTITMQTTQLFYVKSYEDTHSDGTVHDRWYLVGQEDLGVIRGNDDISWGAVKALFM
ncbi:MAG: hypothetical protein GY752_01750 [bacterium]|nr:hypothetical protein [bacterium]MCP4798561.1 hypothetical protein [bacterium]